MRFFLIFLSVMVMASRCDDKAIADTVWRVGEPEASVKTEPLFLEREQNDLITLWFTAEGGEGSLVLEKISLTFTDESAVTSLASLTAWYAGVPTGTPQRTLMATSIAPGKNTDLTGPVILSPGQNFFVISFTARPDADLLATLQLESLKLTFSDGIIRSHDFPSSVAPIRFAKILRAAGQDGVDTYRIPGLVTTNAGTLIAVYDNRYNSSKDLQEDIDIGMSRSTDGGRTWEQMRVIMDMGEYGGRPEQLNGVGDPCLLYDHKTNTIWVAALWMSGSAPDKMLWWASQPGMSPVETGQFILVKSTDDGLTWSPPINITGQIKDPAWQLLLQGPGRGITLSDGTLVFPAQFKADIGAMALDGGKYTCHSTIVYSKDGGETWHVGTGAKTNTTEAQVVELADGVLMLNMRDDRNRTDKGPTNGRAVAVTTDLGRTWALHPSSNSALPESNCMASLISTEIMTEGESKKVLFFFNPNDKSDRIRMTIKASLDEGLTWPEEYQLELFSPSCFGYSCMTMVDKNTIAILYEGSRDLFFQKIPVSEIIGDQ